MAKRKDAKALFELITGGRKAHKPMGVPGWFGQPQPAAPKPPAPASVPPPAAISQPASTPPSAPAKPPPVPARTIPAAAQVRAGGTLSRPGGASGQAVRADGEKLITASGGRVRVSLNQVSATVVTLGMILLVVAAFMIGRRTAPARAVGEFPERRDVLDVGVVPVPGAAHGQVDDDGLADGDQVRREKGASYLIVQGGIKDRADAEDIKKFLASRDPAVIVTIHKQRKDFCVKDTHPFRDYETSPQTREELGKFQDRIDQYGADYRRQGGQYDFRQTKTRPWLIVEK